MVTQFKSKEDSENSRNWHLVNAEGKALGRLASEVATLIRGKHKADYTPNVDSGDFVIVINAEKVRLTGKKLQQKLYRSHSGFMGNLKEVKAEDLLAKHPTRLIEAAVKGMLPKSALGRKLSLKLKIFAGGSHPHAAQTPVVHELKYV